MLEAIPEVAGESWPELLAAIESICQLGYRSFALGRHGRLVPIGLQQLATGRGLTRNVVLKASE